MIPHDHFLHKNPKILISHPYILLLYLSGTQRSPCILRAGTREVHNKLEKNRRAHLKECFEQLKKQLPLMPEEKKTSNLSILGAAIRCVTVILKWIIFVLGFHNFFFLVEFKKKRTGTRAWNGTLGKRKNRCSAKNSFIKAWTFRAMGSYRFLYSITWTRSWN